MKRILIFSGLLSSGLFANVSVDNFINKKICDQIVDKQIYSVCYSYKYKGALAGWTRLDGLKVNEVNIKKRPRFYNEKTIPMKYRTKYKDYTGTGNLYNRGHFLASDADFDYSQSTLTKTYSMVNIIPQSAKVNQKTWIKVEKYGRSVASKLGYLNSISIADYRGSTTKIKNNITVPKVLYRIYFNNKKNFLKCFRYENRLDVNWKNDKLKDHEVNCKSLIIN